MHEMSLAESMIELVELTAEREGASRVRRVVLEIGRLAAVDPEAMRFCFDAVARGGRADGAALDIVELPGSGWCGACSQAVAMDEIWGVCPDCGQPVRPESGTEMRVREIEIE